MKNIAFFQKMKDKVKNGLSGKKGKNIFLIIGLIIGVLLLVFSFFIPSKNSVGNNEKLVESTSDYSANVEKKLEQMLLNLNEITNVDVMVMVDSTPKIEYLLNTEEERKTDEKGSSSVVSTTVVFEKNGSVSTPVVVTTIMPKVTGVLVVLNKVSPSTKLNIINSISVVLNIDSKSISILQES